MNDESIIDFSSSSESEDEERIKEDVWKKCEELMRESAAAVPSRITRGLISGIKGTYHSTSLNVQPSRMTKWRQEKKEEEVVTLRKSREVAFGQNAKNKTLITHFFGSTNPTQTKEKEEETLEESEELGEHKKKKNVGREEKLEEVNELGRAEEVAGLERLGEVAGLERSEEVNDLGLEKTNRLNEGDDLERPQPFEEVEEDNNLDEVEYMMQSHTAPRLCWPPGISEASSAIPILCDCLKRGKAKTTPFMLMRLRQMAQALRLYTLDTAFKGQWTLATESVALSEGRSKRYGRELRRWCQDFISDNQVLPHGMNSVWRTSALHADEDLKLSIITHLQSLGKYFSANDLLEYLNTPDVLDRLGRAKKLSLRTAQRWLKILGFRWKKEEKGMYSDGHERKDVVDFRQNVFLPKYAEFHRRAATYDDEGKEVEGSSVTNNERCVMLHHHDETVFYGNDRRGVRWIHNSETSKPYAKGEGQSLMVADFVSPNIGWLRSSDGSAHARKTIRPGKERDGYFSNEEVLAQLSCAMHILVKDYPSHQHVFILDNARTHTKRAETALSARKMTKSPKAGFGVDAMVRDEKGQLILNGNGQPQTERRKINNATFSDGTTQFTYFPSDHPKYPGYFKGMTQLLLERGFQNPERLLAQCPGFKCASDTGQCCQRRILFNEPDFKNVPSLVEVHCKARGFEVLFLPKFHPELNFIEMCWGYSKRLYREKPPAPKFEQIEENALSSLDQVPLLTMRR